MQMDRTTAYNAIKRAKGLLSVQDGHYVLAIQKWASIIDEFEDEMTRVDTVLKYETTEGIITQMLKTKYSEIESIEMLERIIEKLKS